MLILITYDVATGDKPGQKRLRKVARACEDYGTRVQKSVFECQLGKTEWATLKHRLLDQINPEQDSLRFYHLDEITAERTEHHGINKPIDLTEPLIM